MTIETDNPNIERKIVVTFDICSSTAILEDLHKTESTIKWRNFLIWMKKYLIIKSKEKDFFVYKFTGDGWILLFDYDYSGSDLIDFLHNFCIQFKARYKRMVENILETPPAITGITFGIDRGSLIKVIMNNKREYVGRAINVACRLQGAIKDKDKSPQYKALITKPLYESIRHSVNELEHYKVKRKLRNIAGGEEVHCVKLYLLYKLIEPTNK
jgi:class 3 adenylate cyclase